MLSVRRLAATLSTALAVALAIGLLAGSMAYAAQPDPILSLESLEATLNASPSHSVNGYFKTVLRGSKIETIPCTVTGLTGDATPDTAYIMFRATGAVIDDIGGLAAGMSGSPIYVEDGGEDKVVGAISLGEEFSLGGAGLATPIESMLEMRQTFSTQVQPLSQPVMTPSGLKDKVIITFDPRSFEGASHQGAIVARPLAEISIGGLRADSKAFADMKAELAAKGLAVSTRTTPGTGTSTLDTPLVPGASVASLASRGDMWIGSVGTVTYADGDDVLAYGHPAHWLGESDEFLCNATIDGIWPSQQTPYKLGRPATLKGTVTQDRTSGILGKLDSYPADTTITVHASRADTGKSADTAVYFPTSFVSQGLLGQSSFAAAVSIAGFELYDQEYVTGSAEQTTTVVFGDSTHTYEVALPNHVDTYDMLLAAVTNDTSQVIYALRSVLGDGVEIKSVDVQIRFSNEHTGAYIYSVDAPNGLKVGPNRIVVEVGPVTADDAQTLEATLNIPANVPLTGTLIARGPSEYQVFGDSAQEIFDSLSHWSPSNELWVGYATAGYDDEYEEEYYDVSSETTLCTPWVLEGRATAKAGHITASANPSSVGYGRAARITGYMASSPYAIPDTVTVYATSAGQAQERLLGTYDVTYQNGAGYISFSTGALKSNTRVRIHSDAIPSYWDDEPGFTSADGYVRVNVGAAVSVSPSSKAVAAGRTVKLTANVVPAAAAGRSVTFEYYDSGRKVWRKIATKKLVSSGARATASQSWKVLKGSHKVRARYLGGTQNVATSSASIQIKGK